MSIWIKELLRNSDKHIDQPERIKIREACGGECPFTHLSDEKLIEIKNSSGTDSIFLENLCQH